MNAVSEIAALRRGPDFQAGAPLDQHLMWLDAQARDPEAYAMLFLSAFETIGHLWVTIEGGSEYIQVGVCADEHDKERVRWMNALSAHLDATGHRQALRRLLFIREKVADARPRTLASVTRSIRDYLATGGGILVNPQGGLTEKGTLRVQDIRTDEAFAEAGRATRAYHLARRWPGADRQIMRAARLAGHRTDNGWQVLEARS